jgi:hypothetical protein
LPEGGWLLYLEDDVVISPALAPLLPELVRVGEAEGVDCWNLCNRKNSVARQFRLGLSAVSAQAGLSAVSAQAGLSAVSAQAGLSAVSAQAGLSAGAPQPGLSAVSGPADDVVVNELAYPVSGAHGLLIPKRHLGAMLAGHWSQVSDLSMFAAILSAVSAQAGHHPALKIWQVVKPVLVEHVGYISTYDPERRPKTLEVNHAD